MSERGTAEKKCGSGVTKASLSSRRDQSFKNSPAL
jgi:hypothetical protein